MKSSGQRSPRRWWPRRFPGRKSPRIGEEAIAEAVGGRVGIDPATDIYPRLVAAVTAANNVASRQFMSEGGDEHRIRDLLVDALGQIAAGLPPPRRKPATTGDPVDQATRIS